MSSSLRWEEEEEEGGGNESPSELLIIRRIDEPQFILGAMKGVRINGALKGVRTSLRKLALRSGSEGEGHRVSICGPSAAGGTSLVCHY